MLASLAGVKALLGITSTSDDVQLNQCLLAADAAAKSYLRWSPEQTTYTKYLDGSGYPELVLPGRPVNLTVSEVRLDSLGGGGQIPDTFGSATVLTLGTHYTYSPTTGILRMRQLPTLAGWWPGGTGGPAKAWAGLRTYGARAAYWPCVEQAVKVTWQSGYTSVPADLSSAVAQLAAYGFNYTDLGGLVPASTSYIDTSVGLQQTLADALNGGSSLPVLGTIRSFLNPYREAALPSGVR